MTQIITYNEEYQNLCVACAIQDNEDQAAVFRAYVKQRIMELLSVSDREAEELINGSNPDEVSYNDGPLCAAITFSGDSEYLSVEDVPENIQAKENYLQRYKEEVRRYCADHTEEGGVAKYYYLRAMEEAMRFFLGMTKEEIKGLYTEYRDAYNKGEKK